MTIYTDSSWSTALSHLLSAADGDIVQLTNGSYDVGSSVSALAKTSTTANVIFRAQNRLGATLTNRGINITGNKITFDGFNLQFGSSSDSIDYIAINGDDCIMQRNDINIIDPATTSTLQKWIHNKANNFGFYYNAVHGKQCKDDMFLMDKSSSVAISGCKIMHNDFYDFIQLPGDTRSEVIRIGQSAMAMMDFDAEIAYNRIWNLDADTEVISVKASGTNIHHNYLKDTNGSIVLRQAHDCNVEWNVLENCGIRFYGHGHVIRHNQILNNSYGGFEQSIYVGSANQEEYQATGGGNAAPGTIIPANADYARTKDNYVEWNIIDNADQSSSNYMLLGGQEGDTGSLPPIDNYFRYNQLYGSTGTFTHKRAADSAQWTDNFVENNIFYPTGSAAIGDMPSSGYIVVNLGLQRHPDGTYRCVFKQDDSMVGPNGV